MKDQDALKKMAAAAAVEYVKDGQVVGLGTGSTFRSLLDEEKAKSQFNIEYSASGYAASDHTSFCLLYTSPSPRD